MEESKYFAWIYFHGKSINAENLEIFYTQKFSAVRYVSWSQLIEKLHIIDKVGVQQTLTRQKRVAKSETLKISIEILKLYFSMRLYLVFHPLNALALSIALRVRGVMAMIRRVLNRLISVLIRTHTIPYHIKSVPAKGLWIFYCHGWQNINRKSMFC